LTNIILHHSFYSSATLVGDFHLFSSENFSCIDEQSIPIDYWMISCSSGHDLFSFHRNPLFSILPKQQELRQYQLEMFVYGGICSISLSNYSSRRWFLLHGSSCVTFFCCWSVISCAFNRQYVLLACCVFEINSPLKQKCNSHRLICNFILTFWPFDCFSTSSVSVYRRERNEQKEERIICVWLGREPTVVEEKKDDLTTTRSYRMRIDWNKEAYTHTSVLFNKVSDPISETTYKSEFAFKYGNSIERTIQNSAVFYVISRHSKWHIDDISNQFKWVHDRDVLNAWQTFVFLGMSLQFSWSDDPVGGGRGAVYSFRRGKYTLSVAMNTNLRWGAPNIRDPWHPSG
jgi:hypothetical protein